VGTVTTSRGLKLISRPVKGADLIEVRVDALLASGVDSEKILDALRIRKNAVLLTLRVPEEGGIYPWASEERKALFTALLPDVEAIDVELASVKELDSVLALAKRSKIGVILSAHSIHRPVTPATFKRWTASLIRMKPTIAKIAIHLGTRKDLIPLTKLLLEKPSQRWALMGLGPLGHLSRLILGSIGSALVYGYIDQPAAPGQSSLVELREELYQS